MTGGKPLPRIIAEAAEARRAAAVSFLRDLVTINSWSRNRDGVNLVGDLVTERLVPLMRHRVEEDAGGIRHHVLSRGPAGVPTILLVGHLDTVFPPDIETPPFRTENGVLFGPGTADMKGGLVVMIEALRLLAELGLLDPVPVTCLINGDEEVGSPFSAGLVRELAPAAACGLVFECGGRENQIVDRRRGVARFSLFTTGRARHAGVKTGPKASAVVELARMILALEDLNDSTRGVALNVGRVEGGEANNIVPARAWAGFEIRFPDGDTEREVTARIRNIVADVRTPGCSASLEILHRRPCMVTVPGSDRLVTLALDAAGDLGQTVATEMRGGASDGNFLAEMGVPVIDGLGPVGDLDHSPDEYILEDSLVERIALTALLLLKISEQHK